MLFEKRGSLFANGFTVLDPIEPGESVKLPTTSRLSAGAVVAVADHTPYTNEQAGIVVEDSDRIDLDVVEHTRQSRLRAWQEQRT